MTDPMNTPDDPLSPEAVKAARKWFGMTQAEFANMLGLARAGTVSDWETGRTECAGTARGAILLAVRLAESVGRAPLEWP